MTTPAEWHELDNLSGGELRARLLQRGVEPMVVDLLVAQRDQPGGRERILDELNKK